MIQKKSQFEPGPSGPLSVATPLKTSEHHIPTVLVDAKAASITSQTTERV